MEDWHDHMLPPGERFARARSHLFSTTLTPTSDDTFDVEYVLQLEIGGKIPTWLTSPILVDTVKSLFRRAEPFFDGSTGELEAAQKGRRKVHFNDRWHDTAIYDRLALPVGAVVPGPAILEQPDTTVLIEPGLTGITDRFGNTLIEAPQP